MTTSLSHQMTIKRTQVMAVSTVYLYLHGLALVFSNASVLNCPVGMGGYEPLRRPERVYGFIGVASRSLASVSIQLQN